MEGKRAKVKELHPWGFVPVEQQKYSVIEEFLDKLT